ncbi:hypothetical protein D1007_62186 [Hordeum vulgare]|nr:hypothetical protein D1007_62186 [Hordeum vulgare]
MGSESSSSSSSSSPEQMIDGAVKAFMCLPGCRDQFEAVLDAFHEVDGSTEKQAACFEAGEALRKCMLASAAAYESYIRDADKKTSSQA